MADKKRLIGYIVGGVTVAAIGWFATMPEEAPTREPRKSRPPVTGATARLADTFTQEDFEAKFSRVSEPPKNAFVPLVVSSRLARSAGMIPNEIPSIFTGANEKWRYTGTAIEDGVPSALVENQDTGETEFLRTGQAWKNSIVRRITATSLTLAGTTGQVRTFELMQDPVDENGNIIVAQVQPLAPGGTSGILPPGTRLEGGRFGGGMSGPISGAPGGAMGAPQAAAASAPSFVPSGPEASSQFDPAGPGGFTPPSSIDPSQTEDPE